MVESLQADYAREGKPVVFVEHDMDNPQGMRIYRFQDSYGSQPTFGPPWILIDSGYRAFGGRQDYQTVYRQQTDLALARPPAAEVSAWYEREGYNLDVTVRVVNRSGADWLGGNAPAVDVIVYEERKYHQTNRFVRAATSRRIGRLGNGEAGTYLLSLVDVPVIGWDKAHVLALADYRPDPASNRWELAQAAEAAFGAPPTATPTVTLVPTAAATATDGPSPTWSPPTATPTATRDPWSARVYMPSARP